MTLEHMIGLGVAVVLLAYLLSVLFNAEKF
jgi:K+-transporting ATPase KdpF subunit